MKNTIRCKLLLWITIFSLALCIVPLKAYADTDTSPINVMSYGATGNGNNDDRAAIQSAIDAAATGVGGGVVYFPEGICRVEEILVLKSNVTLSLHEDAVILNGINQASHP